MAGATANRFPVGRPGPTDAQATEAYWNWRDGFSVRENLAALQAKGYKIESTSTVTAWIKRGRKLESIGGGPLAKRQAKRERTAAAINALRVRVREEVKSGLWADKHLAAAHAAAARIELEALRLTMQLEGTAEPPDPREVKVTGTGVVVGVDPGGLGLGDQELVDEVIERAEKIRSSRKKDS